MTTSSQTPRRGAVWCTGLGAMILTLGGGLMSGCDAEGRQLQQDRRSELTSVREEMVRSQIEARGVKDESVLQALRAVPRHEFVPGDLRDQAYRDSPLPIGQGQTISQPYIVGLMSELLEVSRGDKVLEVGTGSGYQAAVLAAMGIEVYSIEIVPELCARASGTLARLGYGNVHVRCGDGYTGWPEQAPFAGVIITAAPPRIPEPLVEQLAVGGRMVVPVGSYFQDLMVITRTEQGREERSVISVRFVPMVGEVEKPK